MCLSFLRVYHASESEMPNIEVNENESPLYTVHVDPISVNNEMVVLNSLASEAQRRTAEFPVSIETDRQELTALGRTYGNRRNILVLRISEMEVFQYYVDLYEQVTALHILHGGSASKISRALQRMDCYRTYGLEWRKISSLTIRST
jgi:hypothetical protein